VASDPIDNDPVAFVARLLSGLERLAPLGPEAWEVIASSASSMDTALLPILIATLREREPLRITFDDAQRLTSSASLSVLRRIIGALGDQSQVLIATRVVPDFGLAKLRVGGGVVEIGADELAMDLGAASSMLALSGIDLDHTTLEELYRATEGWPAGLALAGLAIANSSTSTSPALPSGRRREIADYLVEKGTRRPARRAALVPPQGLPAATVQRPAV
jgi:LuxR family maltose regulon positive regulatory protein